MVHEVKVVLWKSLIMGIQWLWKDKAAPELGLEPRTTIALSHQATRTWEKFATSSIADTDLTSSLGIVKGRPAYKEWLLNVVPPYIADQNMIGTIKSAPWYWQSWQNQDIVLYSLQDTHPSTVGQKNFITKYTVSHSILRSLVFSDWAASRIEASCLHNLKWFSELKALHCQCKPEYTCVTQAIVS